MMNSKQKIAYSILFSLLVLTGLNACKKDLIVDNPIDQLVTSAVFADSSYAEAAVNGLYSRQNIILNGVYGALSGYVTLLPALSSDEIYVTTATSNYAEFASNGIQSNNAISLSNWTNAYNVIYHANAIMHSLEKSTALTPHLKLRLTAEAKFFRALNLFYLTNEYGPIPVPISDDYKANATIFRSDTTTVLNQVINDLVDAQSSLPTVYPSTGKIKVINYAATALLAKVYLYKKDYTNAIKFASMVIASGKYSMAAIASTFTVNNTEAILQFAPVSGNLFNTSEGQLFIPTAVPTYALTTQLLDAFEGGDLRKANWTKTYLVGTTTYYYPFKYKLRMLSQGAEYNTVLRLAEQYLIRAEAEAQLGSLPEAINDLDIVRDRAGLLHIAVTNPSISKDNLLNTIFHENQIEFFVEWGHRWFDLKRTGRANAVLSLVKGSSWQSTDVLYPIPYNEILTDPNLTQNESY